MPGFALGVEGGVEPAGHEPLAKRLAVVHGGRLALSNFTGHGGGPVLC